MHIIDEGSGFAKSKARISFGLCVVSNSCVAEDLYADYPHRQCEIQSDDV